MVAASPAELAAAVGQRGERFAFAGDLGARAVEVTGCGERGAGEELGGRIVPDGGGLD
ncbi:hypothetical protein [Streptomyces sp. NPDC101166]|uniref:hypothetical protein n=1 Tax=Streptomyces sp. NPDC101166 TaxID=3366120 RepID=UPI003815B93F